ncbi:MAG: hypothetical protein HOV94_04345 [Saccharothrix sp.]|nr:hypothetical protein [Saccharothrix sp.]
MDSDDPELDAALRRLSGANLYRDNVFRVIGLPVDASPTQIRRRREELALAVKLGTPLPAGDADLPLDPPPDAEAIRAAFESLRSPVVRLTHELLWVWRDDGSDAHDSAVRAHCAALEAEYAGDAIEPGDPDAARRDVLWKEALSGWATLLASDALWDRARERVKDIDDARLTTGTVRRLRSRLPGHIVAVSAGLAVRAAEVGWAAADRHVELLDDSPFDDDLVDRVLRDAVRPAEDRIRIALESARQDLGRGPDRAAAVARDLLATTRKPLDVVAAVLDEADPLTHAVHDQVADLVNRCAVAVHEDGSDPAAVTDLLARARELARDQATIELIDNNTEAATNGPGANPALAAVIPLCLAGRVERAGAILRTMRRRTSDEGERQRIDALLADDYALASPLKGPPVAGDLFGVGLSVYGGRSRQPDGKVISTRFLSVLFVPLVPIDSYVRDDTHVYAKVRLSTAARWWRRIAIPVLLFLVVSWLLGAAAAWWTVGVLCAVWLVGAAYREATTPAWVRQQAEGRGRRQG